MTDRNDQEKPREKVTDIEIKKDSEVKSEKFEYKDIHNMSAKSVKFYSTNFKYSVINFSYFHQAIFYDCDFTGTYFIDCNFRSAQFIRCKFDYSTFRNTLLPYNQILKNLPDKENMKLALLKNLRVNADQIGEKNLIQKLLIEEVKTEIEHKRKAFMHSESYYQNKYRGWNRVKSFFSYCNLSISKILWNHGYSYIRIFWIILIILLGFIFACMIKNLELAMPLSEVARIFSSISKETISIYLDIPLSKIDYHSLSSVYLVVILRYLSIGLIINVFYMKNIKK